MKLITKEMLIKDVAESWKRSYLRNGEWYETISGDTEIVYRKLLKATTEQEVVGAIGNKSWTSLYCNDCEKEVNAVVQLGEGPDYESHTAYICFDCLEKALKLKGN